MVVVEVVCSKSKRGKKHTDNTTTNLSSHVPCVYQETPLGYLVHMRKTLWTSCLEQYTENNIQGDYYTRTLVVYRELHLLDNPSERPTT